MSCGVRQPREAPFPESGQNASQSWTTLIYDSDISGHNILVLLDLDTLEGLPRCAVSWN